MKRSPTIPVHQTKNPVRDPVKRRVMPEIFVKVRDWRYAKAHIRKRGNSRYLAWRDGSTVRELYLGKVSE